MGKEVYKNTKEENSTEKIISDTLKDNQVGNSSQSTQFENDDQEQDIQSKNNVLDQEAPQKTNLTQNETKDETREETKEADVINLTGKENLAEQLATMQELVKDSEDKYIRLAAEFDNYKKRQLQQNILKEQYANEAIAKDLFMVVDSLEIALEHSNEKKTTENFENFIKGIQLVHQQLMKAFKKHYIVKMNALGASFDPSKHEAVSTVETDNVEENKIFAVFKSGYSLHDRVIRPAVVQVSKSKSN